MPRKLPVHAVHPGARVGRWLLLERIAGSRLQRAMWLCRCDCGTESKVGSTQLKYGWSRSCGCARSYNMSPDGTQKKCTICKALLPLSSFSFVDRKGRAVPMPRCLTCTTAYNAGRASYYRLWSARKYGLDANGLRALYAAARGRCEICGVSESDVNGFLCIDHDHATGRVRGLLCRNCNSAIGKLGDSADRLRAAIEYLSR